jgi:uncharacterized membrane protein YvbJ
MKYCPFCKARVGNNTVFCPKCGNAIGMEETAKDKNVFIYAILSFFVPFLGLYFTLAWSNKYKKTSKVSRIATALGFSLYVIAIFIILFLTLLNS